MNAPDYAFHAILTWARAAIANGFSFQPEGGLTRRRNVERRLYAMMNNATHLLPTVRTVAAPHGPSCDVITFDFVPQLLKLLQNQTIMTQDNLLIDVHNPLLPYKSPDGVWSEALSGQVYQDVYRCLVTNPQHQLFVPTIQWIDRTSVTGNDRFSLNPTCLPLPYLPGHSDALFKHGDIMFFCQNQKLHLPKTKHFNLVTTFKIITRNCKFCFLHFGHHPRGYKMFNYLWDWRDQLMWILFHVFFLWFKTCKKAMHSVVVTALTRPKFNAIVDRAMSVTHSKILPFSHVAIC